MFSGPVSFDGQVAVVTGAGRGLGKDYAMLLGAAGAQVIVNDLDPQTTKVTADEINEAGGTAIACSGSITERSSAQQIIKTAVDAYGRIDILINNAGGASFGSFEDQEDDVFEKMMKLNVYGSWAMAQEAWKEMKKQKYGRIVMVASTALLGQPHSASYGAAKGAIFGLMRCLAVDGKEHGILVNCLAPGAFTPTVPQFVQDPGMANFMRDYLPSSAVAQVPAWLAHKDCTATGEFIAAFGPFVSRYFVGQTQGFSAPAEDFTVEAVRDNFAKACEEEGYRVPMSGSESFGYSVERLAPGTTFDQTAAFKR